jgi:tetratricopeptide (TPR) repeat protein
MRDEEEFSFWHVLVRDVAYQQIPRAARAAKHVGAAEWIESGSEGRLADHAEILAHHYAQAVELGRASGAALDLAVLEERLARFSVLAGDRAMRLDIAAAESAYRRGLAVVAGDEARVRILTKLGAALQEQGEFREAEEVYEEALTASRAAGDERSSALAMLGLGRAVWRVGDTARSRDLVLEAIPALERRRDQDLLLAYEYAATVDTIGGRSEAGLEWADKGIALARELGVENVSRHLQMRGLARLDLGESAGIEDLRQALDVGLRLGLGFETAAAYNNLAEIVLIHESIEAGLALHDASLEYARRRAMTHHEMWTRMSRFLPLYELGDWDELLRESDEVLEWDRGQGTTQITSAALRFRACVHAQRLDPEAALREVGDFLPQVRQIADPQTLAPSLWQAAFVHALAQRLEEAVRLAEEFEHVTRGRPNWRLEGISTLARVCVAADAEELVATILDGASARAGNPSRDAAVATARAVLAEANGRVEEARLLYREAEVLWRAWGSVVERGYVLLDLGRLGDDGAAQEGRAIFERLRATPFAVTARAA